MQTQEAKILALLAREDSPMGLHLLDIGDKIGAKSGTLHSIMARLERNGHVESRWQNQTPWPRSRRDAPVEQVTPGQSRRRYYRITADGHRARAETAGVAVRPSRVVGRLKPAPRTA